MILNEIGRIVQSEWLKTFEMRPDMNLAMGEFVVMPDHFHAIIGIGENEFNLKEKGDNNSNHDIGYDHDEDPDHGTGAMHCASTTSASTSSGSASRSQNKFGPQSKNLGSIIRGFKSGVTIRARSIEPDFAWQTRFHDHIIRNGRSFERISEYIKNNPANWKGDKFHE